VISDASTTNGWPSPLYHALIEITCQLDILVTV
jgi:hypothetical protein